MAADDPLALINAAIQGNVSLSLSLSLVYLLNKTPHLISHSDGKNEVTIPPGTYRLTPQAANPAIHILIQGAEDLHIDATDVTFVCTKQTRCLELKDCKDVTIKGLEIDYDPLPFTQGQVANVDADSSSIYVSLAEGYPRQPWTRIDIVDPRTHYRKTGMPYLWGAKADMDSEIVVRVTHENICSFAEVGDLISLSASNGCAPDGIPHAMAIEHCRGGIKVVNVSIRAAPGMGLVETAGKGGTELVNVTVAPRPESGRLLATNWDAILHNSPRRGPQATGCRIEHCGDDGWSVTSMDWVVGAAEGKSLILIPRDPCAVLTPGDHITSPSTQHTLTLSTITPVSKIDASLDLSDDTLHNIEQAQAWSFWSLAGDGWVRGEVEGGEGDVGLFSVGMSVVCSDRQGNGFGFRDNYMHSVGRILIKASDGVVENNTLIGPSGIKVDPEVPEGAAALVKHVVIRNNHIIDAARFCSAPWSKQAGAVSLAGSNSTTTATSPHYTIQDITIESNTIENGCGVDIGVVGVKGVSIINNKFVNTHMQHIDDTGKDHGADHKAIVWLKECKDVVVRDNKVEGMGTHASETLVLVGEDVEGVEGDKDGIVVVQVELRDEL